MNDDILGFSCVENHVLEQMYSRCEAFGLLYFDSYMPLDKMYKFAKENSFEYFAGVERIQNILKRNDLMVIERHKMPFHDFKKYVSSLDDDTIILMVINAVNTRQLFMARGLREDHYVRVICNNNEFTIINDIPYKRVLITGETLRMLYMNDFLVLGYKPFYSAHTLLLLENQRKYKLNDVSSYIHHSSEYSSDFLVTFRNMLVVFKTMRSRLNVYLKAKGYKCDLTEELNDVTKLIAKTEYTRLRKIHNKDTYDELIDQINRIDEEIFEKIRGKKR